MCDAPEAAKIALMGDQVRSFLGLLLFIQFVSVQPIIHQASLGLAQFALGTALAVRSGPSVGIGLLRGARLLFASGAEVDYASRHERSLYA
jgi:hypothetical protein